jgi:hypothetical protein
LLQSLRKGNIDADVRISPNCRNWPGSAMLAANDGELKMRHLPQDLHDVFPEDAALLRALKTDDRHFQALAERYAALDDEIRRSEDGSAAAMSDDHAEALKKQRLAVLDDIAAHLASARSEA